MVKIDVNQDYYADLELTPAADAEEIKKQFRKLAKTYHPDRNPGHELEVTAKFQAVQAAHEILCDPQQKAKYDAERAKQAAQNNSSAAPSQPFRRNPPPPPPPPPTANYPPPPTRGQAPTRARAPPPFQPSTGRTKPPPPSGADKYASFTNPGTNSSQWDRNNDAQTKAEAMRGFRSWKNDWPPPFPNAPSMPPPQTAQSRPTGPSTASYTGTNAPRADAPRHQRSWDQFHSQPQPGFPGMARTANTRRPVSSFTPNTGRDEPPPPRTPGYTAYPGEQRQRPHAATAQSYFPEAESPRSPHAANREPPASPLRHTQSSTGLEDSSRRPFRPELDRISTQYAHTGGEKTVLSGVTRSASFRSSSAEKHWGGHEKPDPSRSHAHHGHSHGRHHSASPQMRPRRVEDDLTSSDSDSSFEERPGDSPSRRRAQARSQHEKHSSNDFQYAFRHVPADGPPMAGHQPRTNHTKAYSPQDEFTARYEYPPPPPRSYTYTEGPPLHSSGHSHMNGGKTEENSDRYQRSPEEYTNKYGPSPSIPRSWSEHWRLSLANFKKESSTLNGLPSWAVPSSVLPQQKAPADRKRLKSIPEEVNEGMEHELSKSAPESKRNGLPNKADLVLNISFAGSHHHHGGYYPREPGFQTVSQENIGSTFSAADWDGKFNSGEEIFRPTEGRERVSPSRSSRARTRSTGKGNSISQNKNPKPQSVDETKANEGTNAFQESGQSDEQSANKPATDAFQPGKFSAEEWAEKLKDPTWTLPSTDLNSSRTKPPKTTSKSGAARRAMPAPVQNSGTDTTTTAGEARRPSDGSVDPMDIDDTFSDTVPQSPPTNSAPGDDSHSAAPRSEHPAHAGVDLKNLANVTPFAPSSTGLRDLNDLSTTLPFESQPATSLDLDRTTSVSSSSRDLNLPKPPKPIPPPPGPGIDQDTWERYTADMNAYFYDWRLFNKKMIEHFRSRQEQVDVSMAERWISMISDGPPPDADDGRKAGYRTYMAWLEEDAKCRAWWSVAIEKHRKCFEDLGQVRERVKIAVGRALAS